MVGVRGWRISREKFMENLTWINDLKLRVGYGITGNNDFGAGYTVRMYSVGTEGMWAVNGIWQNAYGTTINMNPDLKWGAEERAKRRYRLFVS